jgi:hypothetical protein
VSRRERQQHFGIARINGFDIRDVPNSRVAGRADDGGDRSVAREAPGEGMFAAAAAHDQEPHGACKSLMFKWLRKCAAELVLSPD